ncbi:hypothetical protein F5884DRAFT_333331 [Xylogone sp. PMI_703]|nr:hypothetical protein F5884DRAFT_333331 [Xylogone sp. PMI_703]
MSLDSTMALESPLVSSPGNVMSAFSPYTEFSMSPNSPAMPKSPRYQSLSARSSAEGSGLRPTSSDGGLFPSAALMAASPSDMVGPSPVTSNGTEITEIEDEISEDVQEEKTESPHASSVSNSMNSSLNSMSTVKRLSTNLPEHFRTTIEDESVSVIHAPEGFGQFIAAKDSIHERSTPTPYQQSTESGSPKNIRVDLEVPEEKMSQSTPVSPPPISTDIAPVKYALDNATPRAQTRQEIDAMAKEKDLARSSSSHSLEGIPEDQHEAEEEDVDARTPHNSHEEVKALLTALNECWTLCNTLASLSSIHRERIFSYSGTGDAHEKAWKCCWRLCQKLYDSKDEDQDFQVGPTLDLCREFCQALFDVRQRMDEVTDSVLRVSFELNNHLFNTHDRTLPEAFRERTLDFYITLCHRLMKQRSELAEETDSLLRACWGLAEMLFSLRQNKREGKDADEELLGSAVQACWELCDLFREGWTQVRPERGTPRPSQTTFGLSSDQASRSSHSKSNSLPSVPENPEPAARPFGTPYIPETPTTEFEDTPISPEENSPSIPNILVLGTDQTRASSTRWSSANSTLSTYSQGSNKTSSTVTNSNSEDPNLTRLKILILKAAMNVGFSRSAAAASSSHSSHSGKAALQQFVKSLPTGSFGSLPAHATLLTAYRNLVLTDPAFRNPATLPAPGKRANAVDVAKSVSWMMRSGQYTFLKDLFRLVFGFHLEEAETRKNVSITV